MPSCNGRGGGTQSKVKVEMQRLYMSQENQDLVRETLLSLAVREEEEEDELG